MILFTLRELYLSPNGDNGKSPRTTTSDSSFGIRQTLLLAAGNQS
jgi:hypothetical protein